MEREKEILIRKLKSEQGDQKNPIDAVGQEALNSSEDDNNLAEQGLFEPGI